MRPAPFFRRRPGRSRLGLAKQTQYLSPLALVTTPGQLGTKVKRVRARPRATARLLPGPPKILHGRLTSEIVTSRDVSYQTPDSAQIVYYQALIYYNNRDTPVLLEDFGVIIENPYVFPAEPYFDPSLYSGDPDYLLVIRAYYPNGSFESANVLLTPRQSTPVFRYRHRALA